MAKVWKKLQRADSDFAGNVTGQVGGTSASDVKDGAVAGSAAKTITDAAFDSNTKLKTANAADGLLNSQVTVAKDSSGNISLNNAGSGSISLDNSDVGLSNVTNHAQVKTDGSNAPDALKNDQITLTASGGTVTLNNAGSGSITKSSIGLSSVENKSQADILGGTLTGGVSSSATIDGTAASTVKSGAADGATAKGITDDAFTDDSGTPKLNVANANNSLRNDQISLSASGGTVTLSGASSSNNTFTKSSIGLSSVENKSQADILSGDLTGKVGDTAVATIETGASNGTAAKAITDDTFEVVSGVNTIKDTRAPASLKNSSISLSASSGTVTVSGISSSNNTFGKSEVGLGSVVNQKVAVVSGKIQLDDVDQTIDADKIGGKTRAETEAAAVTTATSNIVGTSPGVLDTLTKISTSLGNQSNAYSSLTTSIGTKAKAPMTLTAEDVDGDSSFDNDPANEVVGQIGVVGGQQYVVVDE